MSEFLDEFCFQYPRYTSLFLHCSSNNSKTVSASGNTRALKSGFTINLNLWRAKMRLSTPFVKKTKSSQWRQRQLSSSVMELSKWTHSYFFKGLVLWQLVDSMRTPEMCRYPLLVLWIAKKNIFLQLENHVTIEAHCRTADTWSPLMGAVLCGWTVFVAIKHYCNSVVSAFDVLYVER